jgi:diguanylate cyclase (GGDEF)-like protein
VARKGSAPARAVRLDLAGRVARGLKLPARGTMGALVRAVHATEEPAEVAAVALGRAASWLSAPAWAVICPEWATQTTVLAGRGLDDAAIDAARAAALWVVNSGGIFGSADLARDARVRVAWSGSVLAFPMACRGRTMGALIALDPVPSRQAPRVSRGTASQVGQFLEPIAGALDLTLKLKRAEALSVTDDLTRLYNSRYLNQVLRRETKRAGRSGRPLSLLFVDLDGFKSINDTYGHVFGSRALIEAGRLIRESARETDVVARFGGDEFALILPDTGAPGARAVAERVRERVATHAFLAPEGLDVRLTASVGIATLPDCAVTAEELVQAADAAMYRVKDRGKNGIQFALVPADK